MDMLVNSQWRCVKQNVPTTGMVARSSFLLPNSMVLVIAIYQASTSATATTSAALESVHTGITSPIGDFHIMELAFPRFYCVCISNGIKREGNQF